MPGGSPCRPNAAAQEAIRGRTSAHAQRARTARKWTRSEASTAGCAPAQRGRVAAGVGGRIWQGTSPPTYPAAEPRP
eukprot:793600-Alexandrium_andersonii.AAC.1